ncbi:MAG TPA: hypothetical protein ENK04_14795 [Gammaproteobacteria bacterium]|nr:hypothetical protein [Gammaproteobacteria bacterium]
MRTYKVKDLMVNLMPLKTGGGSVAYPGPDSDTSEFPTPLTPVIAVARDVYKLQFLDSYKGEINRLEPAQLERVATDIGRAAVGGGLLALCSQDMATCEANENISPFASSIGGFQLDDLVYVKGLLNEAVARIEGVEAVAARRAKTDAQELIPMFEGALEELRSSKGEC